MTLNCRLAVLGAGNLGEALIAGILKAGAIDPKNIVATVRSPERAAELGGRYPVTVTAGGNRPAAERGDVLVIAVKPPMAPEVIEEIKEVLRPEQVLVSLAAAVPLERLERCVSRAMPIFRAMPNVAMRVQESATAICANPHAGQTHRDTVEQIFRTVGTVAFVAEEMMHAVTALSGSGPAYVCLMMEALAAGGAKAGLAPDIAGALARQTVLGAAKLVQETGLSPAALRDQVTTPGGTTSAGLAALETFRFQAAVAAAVEAGARRSREMTQASTKG